MWKSRLWYSEVGASQPYPSGGHRTHHSAKRGDLRDDFSRDHTVCPNARSSSRRNRRAYVTCRAARRLRLSGPGRSLVNSIGGTAGCAVAGEATVVMSVIGPAVISMTEQYAEMRLARHRIAKTVDKCITLLGVQMMWITRWILAGGSVCGCAWACVRMGARIRVRMRMWISAQEVYR
mgnify:CR=1 FL=1